MSQTVAVQNPKDISIIGDLGKDIDMAKVGGHIDTIRGILSRPIDGLNIVTTSEVDTIQFYGWGSPVASHVDGSGYIFFMPLSIESDDYLVVGQQKIKMEVGKIYALNDAVSHRTEGKGRVVAAFYGSVTAQYIKDNPDFMQNLKQRFKEACY